ncbi:hypothetical protein A3I50_01630 [Candidatus Roizmanbacteria bacterium RIFCSPLOWO2_02_FULL_37_9]|uniref:Soluble ligand binding domain-containing protein n=1 Tax=Candidatus Roizmanbacteria bacterium RIFCSPLOWO2_01_FULL_37_16 TaxID=1802058 RepID=A0A1F7IK64_9BACT|nr:MAG: hypothetical protein A2859_05795 [Candidatus Roizmanbacteria bacterium RIFCSPHIGHO2_01_FULL_37_16b]OGK31597.1 MAG: hypothetical protein A3F57_04185 [Candidatus Roizmanbacteria bacterium RIFCSPHIGHO2_12_FULL_36_11]OGK43754.1 MAG: hypothetical protein A3B40_02950 [Candidatus Roizmanbacteria bacterium RIFCSPLOWO2_01_FULL_37_16]OGK57743.1 MAG: hypothetical protein A3I50_01630 [Candidatus Roizmanbacteria bacterium RIFCSPLOWO2_02_FULL_37_9]
MQGFLESFSPIWLKYKIEVILLSAAFVIILTSGLIFVKSQEEKEDIPLLEPVKISEIKENKIFVDLSGAVENPNVYEITSGARLKDVLVLAGGLSSGADRSFFSRNFNLARILADQEKIYIPSSEEIEEGRLKESEQALINVQGQTLGASSQDLQSGKIKINSAPMDELDTLPGVGKVTAQKIIQNRPYESIEDLLNKKIVGKSVFEKIKDQIDL